MQRQLRSGFPTKSRGQLQRAMTAMALCAKPDLVIFDEPTTALDVTTQREVLSAIRKAIALESTAAIYISHDLPLVAQIADSVLVLRRGRSIEEGPVTTLIRNPADPYTQALLSAGTLSFAAPPRPASRFWKWGASPPATIETGP